MSEQKRVAMVTGGNRGIGRGITEALLQQGWAVAIMATRPAEQANLESLAELGEVHYTQGSVAELADHQRYLDEALKITGRIDALVNNAGIAPKERLDILQAGTESFDRLIDVNLRGPYFLTQLVANQLIKQEPGANGLRGAIANITSISSEVVSIDRGEYCISKAGQTMATKLWAARLAPEGVLVYEVRPGVIATDMTSVAKAKYDKLFAEGLAPIPRWGAPADLGSTVATLVSGAMPYSTGDTIFVDGGMHLQRL